LASVLLLLL